MSDLTFTDLGPGHIRFWSDHWDEHTCAEVDFVSMTYTVRFQRAYEEVDWWEKRPRKLRRVDERWETFIDDAECAELAAATRQSHALLRDHLEKEGHRIPTEYMARFRADLVRKQAEFEELERGPRWCPLADYECEILDELHARFAREQGE